MDGKPGTPAWGVPSPAPKGEGPGAPGNAKDGIRSDEVHRSIGVTQKSAWFMLHRIREAMKNEIFAKMGGDDGGPVEADETFS